MSRGEFDNVARAVGGWQNLVDPAAKDKQTLALLDALVDWQKEDKLFENQQLLKQPIVRNGRQADGGLPAGSLGFLAVKKRVAKAPRFRGNPFLRAVARQKFLPLISPWGQNLAPNRALGLAASHTPGAKFPCMCPVHPHMSAGQDFFDNLARPCGEKCRGGATVRTGL